MELSSIETLWNVLGPLLIGFAVKYPVITTIIFFVGSFRLIMKPLMTGIEAYIASTVTKSDDEFIKKIKANKIYQVVVYFLDWALSVKLPK